jgi:outer membrane protein TolC
VRRRDLRVQVRRAFADYYRASRELALHREHIELTARLVELARASYRAGQRGQQDVLRIGLELARVHGDLAHLEQEERSARALLNALMNRPIDAPLGRPAELAPSVPPGGGPPPAADGPAPAPRDPPAPETPPAVAATGRRPELAAADAAIQRGEAALELARREARWPSVMVGADYMYMPFMESPHTYGAMVSISLPWLNARRDDEIGAAERAHAADEHARDSVHLTVRFEVRDALARHQAALQLYRMVKAELLPAAQRSFESAQTAFAAGRGSGLALLEALRSLLLVRIDETRALAELASSVSDLERAVGTDLERAPVAEGASP